MITASLDIVENVPPDCHYLDVFAYFGGTGAIALAVWSIPDPTAGESHVAGVLHTAELDSHNLPSADGFGIVAQCPAGPFTAVPHMTGELVFKIVLGPIDIP